MTAGGELEEITMMEWVKLKVSDPSNLWTAKTVRAIVSPKLCSPVLLGLPFLVKNNIVIDHAACTVVDKMSGFDLMNPKGAPELPAPKPRLQEVFKKVQTNRAEVLKELKETSVACWAHTDASCEKVNEPDIAAVVRLRVEVLAAQEKLTRLGDQIKSEFKDVFQPIPHVDNLPTDVYCGIRLKDASQTIATCSYSSPRWYRDAWSILIQQHLDTGRIRPSN
jgi:hypothetical protein